MKTQTQRDHLAARWKEVVPADCRAGLATAAQLRLFEEEHGTIPEAYRWFLMTCGGGPIGSEWVDDITRLGETHRKFKSESKSTSGWGMSGVFVVGWDGAGSPYGIRTTDGRVVVEEPGTRRTRELASSFEAFLSAGVG
jgi:hypothetical protein